MKRFEGKRAIITGASSGVGKATAILLAAEGASVTLVGRDSAKLSTLAEKLSHEARSVESYTAEFCDGDSVSLLAKTLVSRIPKLDFLIHSAGMIKIAPFASASLDDLDTHYRCNVRAPVALTQALLPALTAARGTVIFVNSTVVDHARAGVSQYAASKHALKAVADSLREEISGRGVRVLSLFLGRTATPMQERVFQAEKREYQADRLIQPDDVAAIIGNALSSAPTVELTNIHVRPALSPA